MNLKHRDSRHLCTELTQNSYDARDDRKEKEYEIR